MTFEFESDAKSIKANLQREIASMIVYAQDKFNRHDWHGVRDACVDIEKLELELQLMFNV